MASRYHFTLFSIVLWGLQTDGRVIDARVETPWKPLCFLRNKTIHLSWIPPNTTKSVDHFIVKTIINSRANSGVRTYWAEEIKTFHAVEGYDNISSYRFSLTAVFNDGTNGSESETIIFPKDKLQEKILYVPVGNSATFEWRFKSAMKYIVVKHREKDKAILQLEFRTNTLSINDTSYQERLTMGEITNSGISFTLDEVKSGDAGYYMSVNYNNHSMITGGQLLIVTGMPKIQNDSISKKKIITGSSLQLKCGAVSTSKPDYHGLKMSYSWMVSGKKVNAGHPRYFVNGSHLVINKVERSDGTSNFTCNSKEEYGVQSGDSRPVTINPLYGPDYITIVPANKTFVVQEYHNLQLINCSADCNPPCSIVWEKFNGSTGMYLSYGSKSKIKISNVSRHDDGKYRCVVKSPHQGIRLNATSKIQLTVNYEAKIIDVTPHGNSTGKWNKTLEGYNITFTENDDINIICKAEGRPLPSMEWRNENTKIGWQNSTTGLVLMKKATCELSGQYICTAQNRIGDVHSRAIWISVKCRPSLSSRPTDEIRVRQGDDVLFNVFVISFPEPSARLLTNGSLFSNVTVKELDSYIYSITVMFNATEETFSTHVLEVSNGVGSPLNITFTVVTKDSMQEPTNEDVSVKKQSWLLPVLIGAPVAVVVVICVVILITRNIRRKKIAKFGNGRQSGEVVIGQQLGNVPNDRQPANVTTHRQPGDQTTGRQPGDQTTGRQDEGVTTSRQIVSVTTDRENDDVTTDVVYSVVNKDRQKIDANKPLTKQSDESDQAGTGKKTNRNNRGTKKGEREMIYLDVEIGGGNEKTGNQNPNIIHGEDTRTDYTFVDFSKTNKFANDGVGTDTEREEI